MAENWKNLEDSEDFAYFRAELVEMSPESYSERRAAQVDGVMVDGLPVRAVVREVFPVIRIRHRPAPLSLPAARRLIEIDIQ